MAHFFMPPGYPRDAYDLNLHTPLKGDVWRLRIRERTRGVIALRGGGALSVVSSNSNVVPSTQIIRQRSSADTEIISLYGMNDGTAFILAGTGDYGTPSWSRWVKLQVTVKERTEDKRYLIDLRSTSMALNSLETPVPYSLDITETVPITETPDAIIRRVEAAADNAGGRLRHLAISSHGMDARIQIGSGIESTHTALFWRLRGKVGVIWAGSCALASSYEGKAMCEHIVTVADCYMVAATHLIPNKKVPGNRVDVSPLCMPVVFAPPAKKWDSPGWVSDGDAYMISLREFLGYGSRLGFVVKA